MTIKKILLGLSLLAAFQLNVSAVDIITFEKYGIGSWDPGSKFNGDNQVLIGVNHAVAIWNDSSSTPEGNYTFDGQTAYFTKGNPSCVTGTLPDATSYVNRNSLANLALTGRETNSSSS